MKKLDPEEVRQIVDGCFRILMGEIHKWEGTITQFISDGFMAIFGADTDVDVDTDFDVDADVDVGNYLSWLSF